MGEIHGYKYKRMKNSAEGRNYSYESLHGYEPGRAACAEGGTGGGI